MTIHHTTGVASRVIRLLDEITSFWGASTAILIAVTGTLTWDTIPRGFLLATALVAIIHHTPRWNR